ncbi:MAG: hypothetical protein LBC64_01215 [Fibromonadaceae bacterium]|jgi:hypothetical protein|nr:hypothetical protein [Fibromonadaceae bacterium]
MRLLILALFSLCLFACIDEYVDSIEIYPDGSAMFFASVYPCDSSSNIIEDIKETYDSIEGLKFDSAWFSKKDSLYSLNFKLSFENLLSWKNGKIIDNDLIGFISLRKIDSLGNAYSFERVINQNAEIDGMVVPEEVVSPILKEQMENNDSIYWEYFLVLPNGSKLVKNKPENATIVQAKDPLILNWRFPASQTVSKRLLLKADFYMPDTQKSNINWIAGAVGCIIMLLAIALLVFKLKKLGTVLRELKDAEKNIKE